MPPVVYGRSVRHDRFAEQRLDDRTGDDLGQFEHFVARAQAAASGKNRDLRAAIDHVSGGLQARRSAGSGRRAA